MTEAKTSDTHTSPELGPASGDSSCSNCNMLLPLGYCMGAIPMAILFTLGMALPNINYTALHWIECYRAVGGLEAWHTLSGQVALLWASVQTQKEQFIFIGLSWSIFSKAADIWDSQLRLTCQCFAFPFFSYGIFWWSHRKVSISIGNHSPILSSGLESHVCNWIFSCFSNSKWSSVSFLQL